jgi:hypothetical protein
LFNFGKGKDFIRFGEISSICHGNRACMAVIAR